MKERADRTTQPHRQTVRMQLRRERKRKTERVCVLSLVSLSLFISPLAGAIVLVWPCGLRIETVPLRVVNWLVEMVPREDKSPSHYDVCVPSIRHLCLCLIVFHLLRIVVSSPGEFVNFQFDRSPRVHTATRVCGMFRLFVSWSPLWSRVTLSLCPPAVCVDVSILACCITRIINFIQMNTFE